VLPESERECVRMKEGKSHVGREVPARPGKIPRGILDPGAVVAWSKEIL